MMLTYDQALVVAAAAAHDANRLLQLAVTFDLSASGSDWWEITKWEDLTQATKDVLVASARERIEQRTAALEGYRARVEFATWQALKPYLQDWPARCR